MSETWELSKAEMTAINNNIPAEAKYGEVFVEIAHAAQKKLLEWGYEFCLPHVATGYVGGNNRTRFECPRCMADLRAKMESK